MNFSLDQRKHTNTDHAELARRLVFVVRAARLAGDDRAANRASRRLQKHLDAHLSEVRRSSLP